MAAVIEVEELRKRYGGLTAVDGVSFRVAEREVFGIVGPLRERHPELRVLVLTTFDPNATWSAPSRPAPPATCSRTPRGPSCSGPCGRPPGARRCSPPRSASSASRPPSPSPSVSCRCWSWWPGGHQPRGRGPPPGQRGHGQDPPGPRLRQAGRERPHGRGHRRPGAPADPPRRLRKLSAGRRGGSRPGPGGGWRWRPWRCGGAPRWCRRRPGRRRRRRPRRPSGRPPRG